MEPLYLSLMLLLRPDMIKMDNALIQAEVEEDIIRGLTSHILPSHLSPLRLSHWDEEIAQLVKALGW